MTQRHTVIHVLHLSVRFQIWCMLSPFTNIKLVFEFLFLILNSLTIANYPFSISRFDILRTEKNWLGNFSWKIGCQLSWNEPISKNSSFDQILYLLYFVHQYINFKFLIMWFFPGIKFLFLQGLLGSYSYNQNRHVNLSRPRPAPKLPRPERNRFIFPGGSLFRVARSGSISDLYACISPVGTRVVKVRVTRELQGGTVMNYAAEPWLSCYIYVKILHGMLLEI